MNEAIGCPRHSVSLVRQIASGDEPVAHFKCPEKGCNVSAPEVGCLWCGQELEVVDVSVKTDSGLWSAILRCGEHGRWWWQQGQDHLRKVDDDREPARIARLRSPERTMKVANGDLIVKPEGATGPQGGATFYRIDEWGTWKRVEGPYGEEDHALSRAKTLAERRGVRLWRDVSSKADEWELQGPPIF